VPAIRLKRGSSPVTRPAAESSSAHWLAGGFVCVAVILGPLLLGGTGAWARLGLEAVMVLVVVLCAIAGRADTQPALAPLLACGTLLLQVVPLPDHLLVAIAPLSAGAWKVATEGAPGATGCIAVDPSATLAGCRRMLVGLAGIVAIAELLRERMARRAVISALAVASLIIIAAGVLFPVEANEKILLGFVDLKGPLEFWRSPVPAPIQTAGWAYLDWVTVGDSRSMMENGLVGDGFGSYISSNEFAAGVYLTFPAVLATVVLVTKKRLPKAAILVGLGVSLAAAVWVVGSMAKSRAGSASLVFGCMVFFMLLTEHPKARRAMGFATAAAAIALVGFVLLFHGQLESLTGWCPDEWRSRLASLRSDGRVIASHTAMRMFFASPFLGTGLGSYGGIYPRMTGGNHVWYFAHNDYAQLLAETGVLGLGLILVAAGLSAVSYRRFLSLHPPGDRLEGAVAWAGLAALAIHSAFDWNLHVPANAFLAVVQTGLALATARPDGSIASRQRTMPERRLASWLPGFALAGACIVALGFLARDAASETTTLSLRKALAADQIATQVPDQSSAVPRLLAAIAAGERAAARDPANAHLAMLIGQANLRLAVRSDGLGPEREVFKSAASRWFRKASLRCATVRGLPEPLPPTTSPRS
jgi:hypothetical protein